MEVISELTFISSHCQNTSKQPWGFWFVQNVTENKRTIKPDSYSKIATQSELYVACQIMQNFDNYVFKKSTCT